MTVYLYQEGEHPSGFVGARVAVMVNSKRKQKYYSFKRYAKSMGRDFDDPAVQSKAISDAEKQNKLWEQQKEEKAKKRKKRSMQLDSDHSHCKPFRSSGFTGITLCITQKKRTFKDRKGCPTYDYNQPGFRVSSRPQRAFEPVFYIHSHGYSKAWELACKEWAATRNASEELYQKRLRMIPPPEAFKYLRRQMNREGYEIPISVLSPVFAEQREKLKKSRSVDLEAQLKKEVQEFMERTRGAANG